MQTLNTITVNSELRDDWLWLQRHCYDFQHYLDKSQIIFACDLFHSKWIDNQSIQNASGAMKYKYETYEHSQPLILLIIKRLNIIKNKMKIQNTLELTTSIQKQNPEMLKLLSLSCVLSFNHLNLFIIHREELVQTLF